MSDEKQESTADIVADIRERAENAMRNGERLVHNEAVAMLLRSIADRIEAAVDRERRQYERLHECFWDKRAVQCIIRRMRDSRDDLARAYPETARELDYYAGELIRARCECSAGNPAAMREALLFVKQYFDKIDPFNPNTYTFAQTEVDHIQDAISAALAAPPRNCDRFADAEAARQAWLADAENWDDFGSPKLELHEWLYALRSRK